MRMSSLNRAAIPGLPGMARAAALLAGSVLILTSFPGFANVIQVAASATGPGGDQCSLIDAINAANDNKITGACPAGDDKTSGGDVILLASGTYKLTTDNNDWYGPNGLPAITSKITIIGDPHGSIIMRNSSQGGSALRIFYIGGGKSLTGYNPPTDSSGNPVYTALPGPGNLTLQNLTLQNGLAQGGDGGKSDSGNGGGGLGAGGAIYNQGTLVLQGVTLNGNQAIGGNGGNNSTGTSSSGSAGGGGGMSGKGDGFGNGGGFSSNGSWPDSSSAPGTFGNGGDSTTTGGVGGGGGAGKSGGFGGGGGGGSSGKGGFGGGGGFGGVNDGGFGGGGYLFDGGGAGLGGAIFNDGGTITVLNCTFTANNAQGGIDGGGGGGSFSSGSGYGGAIFNLNGSITIRYSTLVANTVTFNYMTLNIGGSNAAGGAVYSLQLANPGSPAADASSSAHLTINSSILYGSNQVTLSSSGNTSVDAVDCINIGSSFSGSHNNIGALSASCLASAQTSFPLLLKLGNYGGPTQTMQLLGGLALGGGDAGSAPSLDQRGYLRDSFPDVGAYENSYTRIAPPTVTGLQDATVIAATSATQHPFNIAGSVFAPAGLTVSVNSSDTTLLPTKDISISSGCGTGTSQATCSLNITPPTDKTGSVTITVTVTDSYGQLGYQSFVLTIIPPPPVASDVSLSTASNQELAGTLKATEALNAQLSYSIVSQPSNGTVKLTSANSSAFSYNANTGFTGKDSFTFKANDGSSDSNVATVTITVNAPVAIPGQLTASDLSLTAYENTTATGTLSILGGSGQGLSISIGTKPAHGTVTITDVNSGTFTYAPSSGYVGADSFTYSAKDSTLNTTSNKATVSITVNAVTATGAAAPIASKLTLATYAGIPITGTLTASDAAGNAVSYTVTQPSHGTLKLNNAATGAFTYTPTTGYTGADSFTFKATDTVTKLVSSAATASLTISSIPVSDSAVPLASDAAFTTYSNVPVSATLSASDAAGNALNYVLATAPTHGIVTITATTGAFVYTPTSSYAGKDSFTFTATDTSTGVSSKTATVSLTVSALPSPASTAPTANDVLLATYANLPVSGVLTASDASGNPLTYTITVQPIHSTAAITLTGNAFTYTPAASYTSGTDSFTFTATDTVTGLVSAPATASFIVNLTPAAPAAPATSTLTLDTYENVAISGTLPAADALGTPLTYAIDTTATTSAPLTAFDPATGTFTYTPTTAAPSADSFTFTAANTLTSATSAATAVNITINALPGTSGTPLASDGTVSLYENTPFSGTLFAVDD
ncbi:MAG: beta strand repeat-containing protein, partial [Gammaproteobacteria bacterium]